MNSFVPGSPKSSNLQDPPSDRTLGCSLFLCGLPTTSALLSLLDWKDVGSGLDHRVEKARLQLQGGSVITLFRHVPREDSSFDIAPEHLHGSLNLSGGKSGFLFVHDASNPDVEASVRSLRDSIELQRRHGSRGFWVAVSTAQGASVSSGVRNDMVARFRDELASAGISDAPAVAASLDCVLEMPVVDAARMVGDALLAAPRPSRPGKPERGAPSGDNMTDQAFRQAFLRGNITPWTHMDYLRAAYITLLECDVRDLDLLEVATIFATRMNRFRRRNSHAQHSPEPRTLTVFWLYHVRLALVAMLSFSVRGPTSFKGIFRYFPELVDERLPSTYFSPDVLASSYSRDYWMLPNLRELVELVQYRDSQFRHKLTRPQHEDPHRLLRFAFAVVQRYLRPGETRRRAWFTNLALDSLRRQTMRLRSLCPGVPAYSETQSHFYLHLVHAALLPLTLGNTHLLQNMTYPLFEETFRISPSAWTAYYSPQLWDSIPARARFHPPDLQPLPDTVSPANFHLLSTHPSPNESFRRAGLVPELPSLEVLQFHRAVLLEEAKLIGETPTPAEVTSHAHLLKYIHAHLVLATPPPAPPERSSVSHHLDLLTTASTLPRDHIAFYLSHAAVALLGNRTTGDNSDDSDIKDNDKKTVPLPDGHGMLSSAAAAPWGAPSGSGQGQRQGQGQRPARWEEWAGGESALVLCWDEAWCSALGGVNGPGLPEGRGGEVWSRVEEGDDRDGEGEGEGGEQDDENDTLAGGEGEEEDWEVMSAATTLTG
ncbi:hypothetical protein MYCTH_2305401 [Thermothelomyces thermophilus ATCC 42464]|uniref:Uncharacterized protein n=1 Tax=Thermothelomyces thermophilus (strain ATCC 42464 / BCRC 31852 / DSM 1799) TaxID=573729 RepID=G2QCT2_THET4|nr:uncharacterized protein MYCTH_2305401 [Thermothelomyces thermophilus ATCC 42464]AEO58203.1 hypothetical protein MYCTH_2305401 [Thermothelomyces thermophilus ATCC 42464]